MGTDCSRCRHDRSGVTRVVVDNRTADEYEEWACAVEDAMTEEDLRRMQEGECPFYEYDERLDDPCCGCPGYDEYCGRCPVKIGE